MPSNQENYENWLQPYDWRWYCTFAFDRRVSGDTACRIFQNWIEIMEDTEPYPVSWARALELGPETGRYHIHAVFAGIYRRINSYIVLWEEEFGDVEIDDFDENRGGIAYMLKSLNTEGKEYYVDMSLHPQNLRASRRCATRETAFGRQGNMR